MKYACALTAMVILAATAADVWAQAGATGGRSIVVVPGRRSNGGQGGSGGQAGQGGQGGQGGPVGPGFYGPAFVPIPIYSSVVIGSSYTVIGPNPRPPIVISTGSPSSTPSAPPPPAPDEMDLVNPIIIRPGGGNAPMPGAPAGGFRPVQPEDRKNAQQPGAPEAKMERPPQKERPLREPELNPKEQAARQLALGRQAFANQGYGTAASCFQEATRLAPDDAQAYFLLAQADLALGKYREATAAIHEGLRRKADWPASGFQPKELYGANAADYTEHLEQLRQALTENPRDPVLMFLNAYQLWFNGRQDEARGLFRKAVPLVTEPRFLKLFLDGPAGQPVAVR